ncbi:hypothetical protein [Streptomyces orinoci]|uniref:Uncharacterized protein n=1 Tax=Streptomyces orinoci TaxID=67339 RepID=A0ABV3JRW1_STRON|nr:hypothetical protein [Streptomyces orinoci]
MAIQLRTLVISSLGELESVQECNTRFSRDKYVQGVIELDINHIRILGCKEGDTIDALWSLLVTALENFCDGRDFVMPFPERCFVLSLSRLSGGRVVVKLESDVERRVAVGDARDVVEALAKGAVEFFQAVLRTSPKEEWSYRRDLNRATLILTGGCDRS